MDCLSCGASLPKEALFCLQCGQLTPKGNREAGTENTVLTIASVSSPSDPYSSGPRPPTYYGPPPPEGGMQNPYAPPSPYTPLAPTIIASLPPRRRSSPGFLKGFFIGMLVILVLSSIGGWLLLKQGALSPTAALKDQVSPTAQAAGVLYTADWSSGFNGWTEFPGFQDWHVAGGMLRDDGTNSSPGSPGIQAPYEVTSTSDYAVETQIQVVAAASKPCFDITTIRTSANWSGYRAAVCFGGAMIRKVDSTHFANAVTLASVAFDPKTDWHTYRLEAKETTIGLLIDGHQVLQVNDNTYASGGPLGMNSFQTQLNVRSYKVIAIEGKL